MANVSFHELAGLDATARAEMLKRSESDLSDFVERVRPILDAVRTEGDAALLRFARDLDKANVAPGGMKVTEVEFDLAFKSLDPAVVDAIRFGVDNIRSFHEEQ